MNSAKGTAPRVRKSLVVWARRQFPRLDSSLRALDWVRAGAPVPAPWAVKMKVLERYMIPEATWVETGTYLGATTEFLAERSPKVISLEPAPTLFQAAAEKFALSDRITILNKTSEAGFLETFDLIQSGEVCFWLDGHYSGGTTFAGPQDTPIVHELELITGKLKDGTLTRVAVFIDDAREFATLNRERVGKQGATGYPPLRFLVDWAEELDLAWVIEHDIFIARSRSVDS